MIERIFNLRFLHVLALFFATTVISKADITITGNVADEEGPLIGVTVRVEESPSIAVATDMDGNYSIDVPSKKSTLVFSYIGMMTAKEPVGNRKEINVMMIPDSQMLNEVVAIGYGTQQKSHLTGSITKVEGDAITNMSQSDVGSMLQGVMPGLTVNNTTSEVGVSPTIRVRGTGSISADNDPLIIVDGFPMSGGLSQINPNDIESIEILKDAASAAIYGSRAANGVILVTTKGGTPDKPKYSLKFNQGVKYAYKKHDLMTSTELYELMMYENEMGGPNVPANIRSAAYLESVNGSTDWQSEGLRSAANVTSVALAVSGGKKDLKYYISTSFMDDEGIMKDNKLQKFNFRSRLEAKLSRTVTLGANLSATYKQSSRPRNNFIDFYRTPSFLPVYHNDYTTGLTGYTGFARGSHFNNIVTPSKPVVGEDGTITYEDETTSPFTSANNNPVSVLANTRRWGEDFMGTGSVFLEWEIIKNLKFRTSDGFTVRYTPQYFYGKKNATKDGEESQATFFSTLFVDLLSENTLSYHLQLPKLDQEFDFLLGYTIQKTRNQRVALTGTGFATDDIYTLNAATIFQLASENNGNGAGTGTFRYPDVGLESYLARVNYALLGRYLFSASLRLDRSSLFTKGNRNAWFPSVSVGWRINQEKFMETVSAVNNLKLRASYGMTGNNGIPYYAALEVLSSANYVTGVNGGTLVNGSANVSETLANSNITWEKTHEFNVGIDLGVLNNRISATIDGYYGITESLLFAQPTQSFTGFAYFWNNIGKVRNMGIELQLETYNIITHDFEWRTSFNISHSRNKLLELGGEKQMITTGERNECYIARVGEPMIQYYGYRTTGVWNSQEEIDANPHFATDVPGGLRIEDVDGDGVLTANDRVALGNPYPDFTWGITNMFKWRDFDFSFLFQGVQGITVFNGDVFYNETVRYNKAYTAGHWVSPEMPGDGKTPYWKNGYDLLLTDYPLEDGSYVCLRNVTLGYTLPQKALRKIGLSQLRCYISGNNLAYFWTKGYRGVNPESRMTSGVYQSAMISGYQRGGFPLSSTISIGFDLNF
ncbi:MAG: TonB-dependent receptor [Muribaculaceae bacterium]|nr:TonB-dependent receptor [Muribaculaceae bacterium]